MNVLNREAVPHAVIKMVAETLVVPEEQVVATTNLVEDFEMEAWEMLVIIYNLEEKLGVAVSDEVAEKIKTVQDIINLVLEQAEPAVA